MKPQRLLLPLLFCLPWLAHAAETARPNIIFFLYLLHDAVQNPQQAKSEAVEKYRATLAKLPSPEGPEFITDRRRQVRQVQNKPVHAAMIHSLDESVGRSRFQAAGQSRVAAPAAPRLAQGSGRADDDAQPRLQTRRRDEAGK